VEALVARAPAGSLCRSTAVSSLRRSSASFSVETGGNGAGVGVIETKAVILALPPPKAAPLLSALDGTLAAGLASIPCASTATVVLGYRRSDVAHPLDGYGLLVPRTEGLRTSALSFVSTKFPGRAPSDHVLLRAFMGGTRDPKILELDDRSLVDLVRREMGLVLGLRGEPVVSRVHRWPEATPQMEVGHLDKVAALEARLRDVPGLFVTGAGLRVTGIPDVVADATRAAEAAATYLASGG
jgi:oxygen-dependent protoporphyrinogen oxidase